MKGNSKQELFTQALRAKLAHEMRQHIAEWIHIMAPLKQSKRQLSCLLREATYQAEQDVLYPPKDVK